MLSKVNSVINNGLGEQFRTCSSRSRKRLVALKPAVRARGGDFFRYTDAEKILLLGRLPGRVMFGRLQSFRRWAGELFSLAPIPLLLRSRPARRHSYGPASRTCSVQVGRDGEIKLHYHECCLSSFPRQSKQVLWLSQQPQRFVSSRAVLTCSICSGVGYWLYLHRR